MNFEWLKPKQPPRHQPSDPSTDAFWMNDYVKSVFMTELYQRTVYSDDNTPQTGDVLLNEFNAPIVFTSLHYEDNSPVFVFACPTPGVGFNSVYRAFDTEGMSGLLKANQGTAMRFQPLDHPGMSGLMYVLPSIRTSEDVHGKTGCANQLELWLLTVAAIENESEPVKRELLQGHVNAMYERLQADKSFEESPPVQHNHQCSCGHCNRTRLLAAFVSSCGKDLWEIPRDTYNSVLAGELLPVINLRDDASGKLMMSVSLIQRPE